MNKIKSIIAYGAIAFALAGCGASGSNPLAPSNPSNLSSNVLQFAVGTANLYGTSTGLTVVATYRQPAGGFNPGASGSLVNSPTITLAANLGGTAGTSTGYDGCSTATSGAAASEIGSNKINSTTQNPGAACGAVQTTFGQSGGVFGFGIEPYNAMGQGDFTAPGAGGTGTPFRVAPYPVPLYAATVAAANVLVPWGGPPAFKLAGNPDSVVGSSQLYPAGTAGVGEGIDLFAGVAAVAGGAYSLSVSVPANTGTVTQSANFTLPAALTTLGVATSPAYAADGNGGGTFAFIMPIGATEAYLEIVDYGPTAGGSCNGWASAATPVYYTIEATASGTVTLPDSIGPTAPSSVHPSGASAGTVPSVCTAAQNTAADGAATSDDQIAIQVIGFDYDAYGISYPNSLGKPSPSLGDGNGETDITISAATCQAGATSCTGSLPLLHQRRVQTAGYGHT